MKMQSGRFYLHGRKAVFYPFPVQYFLLCFPCKKAIIISNFSFFREGLWKGSSVIFAVPPGICLSVPNGWRWPRWSAVVVGPLGAAFGLALNWANATRAAQPWLLYLLPAAGLVIVFLYEHLDPDGGGSTNQVFVSVREHKP